MTTFDDREAAFETMFVRDAEQEFLAEASRNKHIAYWAASLMGKTAEQAVRYAKDIIRTDLEEGGDDIVVRKLMRDLGDLSDEKTIRERMARYLNEAREKAKTGELKSML